MSHYSRKVASLALVVVILGILWGVAEGPKSPGSSTTPGPDGEATEGGGGGSVESDEASEGDAVLGAGTGSSPVFEFGDPEIFVTTRSQDFNPYRLVNKYKGTYMLNEYMIFASSGQEAESYLILYDPEETDIVKQNLGKEQYWAFVNGTGALPSMTVSNTTFRLTTTFRTILGDEIQFVTVYGKNFDSRETTPPYDVVFEIPANSGTFRNTKTAVDFQSWGLLRWQLSDKGFVTWEEIKKTVEGLYPAYDPEKPEVKSWEVSPSDFRRIDNPCLPDFFLLYLIVGDKQSDVHQVYADIPAFHLNETIANFYNLTGSFCPHLRDEAHEECGFVQQLVLTNDHMVALTDKGVYISSAIKGSDMDVGGPYEEKPLISYVLVDPCSKFAEYISCFKQGITSLASQLIHSIRLFYTPICNLHQYPFYEDRLIFVVEHTTTGNKDANAELTSPPVRAVTILYASTPYKEWRVLFIGIDKYNGLSIAGLVGVFFNHQLRHFDITLKVMEADKKNFHYRRFVLPDVLEMDSGKTPGYQELNGFLGRGFLEKKFPGTFTLDEVAVNPGSMDVFFMGSQLWISESAGPIVYTSLAGLTDHQSIKKCSFNHPDRSYVCVNSDGSQIIVGRVGSQYSPYLIDVEGIEELWQAGGLSGAYWTSEFAETVIKNAQFTSAYSGNILLWYLHDAEALRESQKKLKAAGGDCAACEKCMEHKPLLQACNQLKMSAWVDEPLKPDRRGAYFRMIAINPLVLTPRREATAGPLVALYIDAGTVLLYEAKLPGDDAEYIYFSGVHIGQEITCGKQEEKAPPPNPAPTPAATTVVDPCRIFIRHIKPVDKFLDGFRQVLYGTLIKPIPLEAVKGAINVLQVPQSNLVFLLSVNDFQYDEKHIGQTHHFPGHFSVILQGFPVDSDKSVMWGYSTIHVRTQKITKHDKFQSFLVDMSTTLYRQKRNIASGVNQKEFEEYKESLKEDRKRKQDKEDRIFAAKQAVQKDYEENNIFGTRIKLFRSERPEFVDIYDPIKILKDSRGRRRRKRDEKSVETLENPDEKVESSTEAKPELNPSTLGTPNTATKAAEPAKAEEKAEAEAPGPASSKDVTSSGPKSANGSAIASSRGKASQEDEPWTVSDGGCHHIMQLMPNPVLFGHGGRVSLDLHDALSLVVKLRGITELGILMLYRPIIVVTNSNADILRVEKKANYDNAEHIQSVSITLTPTGLGMGVASLVIRTIFTSLHCESPSSMTFIVQIHRPAGKRLHLKYPIPICSLPPEKGGFSRPWVTDSGDCIPYQKILEAPEEGYSHKGLVKVYTKLPVNYRPPSHRGEQIPLSKHIYNSDPSKPRYNNWYHVTQDSGEYNKCKFRRDAADCGCSPADRLSDDPAFSDCKQMVYNVKRGKSHQISLELDPLMRDEDQIEQFHTQKKHLSIYLEEVNDRKEYSVISCNASAPSCEEETDLLKEINSNPSLNEGKRFYDAKALLITLHGTGLYHFKAGVGKFDSFQDVTGHFILFSDSNELNHVKLVVVMLITITFCFLLVFCGFIRVRRRLSSQLPFQTKAKTTKLE